MMLRRSFSFSPLHVGLFLSWASPLVSLGSRRQGVAMLRGSLSVGLGVVPLVPNGTTPRLALTRATHSTALMQILSLLERWYLQKSMYIRFAKTIAISALGIISLHAQEPVWLQDAPTNVVKLHEKAVSSMRARKIADAEKHFIKTLAKSPGLVETRQEFGLMLYREGRFKDALSHLSFSVDHLPQVPNGLRFTLASTYWQVDQYQECIATLEPLLQQPLLGEKMGKESRKMYRDAQFSIANPKDLSASLPAVSLGEAINSEWPEYLPAITADEQTLIFTRRQRGKEDFFTSRKQEDGTWSTARPMNELNRAENEGAICIAADGKTIIYTICNDPNGYGNCDLYISEKVLNRWSPARNLGGTINTKYKETQPSLSPDGQSLYFVSDRPGGLGGLDIYVSHKDKRGNWQEPTNLGTMINTSEDDLTPYLHFDHQTFYFASEGHPGYGGMDIFIAKLDKEGQWSSPRNLGHPYNSKGDDSCPVVLLSGDKAYLSKEDPLERDIRTMNIYEVTLPKEFSALTTTYVQFRLQDITNSKPLKSVVEIFDLESGRRHLIQQADRDGSILATMPTHTRYAVRIFHPGYIPLSHTFDLMTDNHSLVIPTELIFKQTPAATLADDPIRRDTLFTLSNIYFQTGSAQLNEESTFELQSLVSWLTENPKITIEISGHTDNVGNARDNLNLSQRRAEEVVQQLIQRGVPKERLSAKGYGDTMPIADNNTPEGRAQNRRTAFKIIHSVKE